MRVSRKWALACVAIAAASVLAFAGISSTWLERVAASRALDGHSDVAPIAPSAVAQGDVAWPTDARVRFSDWTSIEADSLPTAMASIVSAGDRLYALSEVGSIYESMDEAVTWHQVAAVRQGPFPISMHQLAVLPAQGEQPAVYFATQASSWASLYRVSRGETREIDLVDNGLNNINRVSVIGSSVYAAGELGLYRSDDRGENWTRVLNDSYWCRDVVGAGSRVYASCVSGVYRSTAGGMYELLSNQYELSDSRLAVSPANPDIVYAATWGAIFRSTDAGQSWTKTVDMSTDSDPVHRALYGELETVCGNGYLTPVLPEAFAVDPNDASIVWVGSQQLFRSDDRAEHFGRASIRESFGKASYGQAARILGLAFRGSGLHVAASQGVYGTPDRHATVQMGGPSVCSNPGELPGVSWTSHRQGINGQQFREVAISGNGSVLAKTSIEGLHYTDLDDPSHWLAMTNGENTGEIFVDPSGGIERFYASWCGFGSACRWDLDPVQPYWTQTALAGYDMGFVAIDPSNPDRVWAGGYGIYRSENAFDTAVEMGSSPWCAANAGAASPWDSNILIFTTGCGAVVRRTDALTLTAPTQAPFPPAAWPYQVLRSSPVTFNDVIFDRRDRNRVFIIGDGQPSVFLSRDAGASWRSVDAAGDADGLPDGDAKSLATDPDVHDVVYLATGDGVYVGWNLDAATGSRVWHEVETPFRGSNIKKLAIARQPDGSKHLFVFTQGSGLWSVKIDAAPFDDVGFGSWAYDYISRLVSAGVTKGCGESPSIFCPNQNVTRDQMAVFLLRAMHGGTYQPPAASGVFSDVPTSHWAAGWVERLREEGITTGCANNPLQYCPGSPVTRDQMAVFLLRAKHGASYQPPAATGMFADVPTGYWAAAWIEQLAREGVTSGCSSSPKNYCPGSQVTRDQMAAFLVRAFQL